MYGTKSSIVKFKSIIDVVIIRSDILKSFVKKEIVASIQRFVFVLLPIYRHMCYATNVPLAFKY